MRACSIFSICMCVSNGSDAIIHIMLLCVCDRNTNLFSVEVFELFTEAKKMETIKWKSLCRIFWWEICVRMQRVYRDSKPKFTKRVNVHEIVRMTFHLNRQLNERMHRIAQVQAARNGTHNRGRGLIACGEFIAFPFNIPIYGTVIRIKELRKCTMWHWFNVDCYKHCNKTPNSAIDKFLRHAGQHNTICFSKFSSGAKLRVYLLNKYCCINRFDRQNNMLLKLNGKIVLNQYVLCILQSECMKRVTKRKKKIRKY